MKMIQVRAWAAAVVGVVMLQACGGGGSSSGDGQVRVLNMTRTHASLDLSANTVASTRAVAKDTVSTYSTLAEGAYALQLSDTGAVTAAASLSQSVAKDTNYVLVAYESNGLVKTAWLSESNAAPAAGSAGLRIVSAASEAGALDVYVTAPGATLTGLSPTFTIGTVLATNYVVYTPGNYQVRVTASGNSADLRLDIPSITLASQQLLSVMLMPTVGGALVDGGTLIEKGAFAAYRNQNARVRVASGVTGATIVAQSGTISVEAGAASPYVGSYVSLPATTATWTVSANGNAAAVAPITLTPGSDNSLLVWGTVGAPLAALVADDNHLPAVTGTVNMRLVNLLGGTAAGLSLSADFSLVSSNVTPGLAGLYRSMTGNTAMRLEVTSALSSTPVSLQTGLNIPGGGVYSIFVLGDATAPATLVRRDR